MVGYAINPLTYPTYYFARGLIDLHLHGVQMPYQYFGYDRRYAA